MSYAISVSNVSKIYHTPSLLPWRHASATEALKKVSFSCPMEKISCLLGPNGAGKTTIIKILAGLILLDAGEATVLGVSLSKAQPNFRTKIGLATPNERSFYWRLTGRQNLSFFASLYGLKGKEKRERVSEVLSEVNLLEEADKPLRLYSAGMRQKLTLARALLGRPEVLLLDEPTTHLDPLARKAVHKLIRERFVGKRRTTVLLCTHDLNEAKELADHLIFLHEGSVQAEGTLASLRAKLHPHIRLMLEFDKLPHQGWKDGFQILHSIQNDRAIEIEINDTVDIPDIIQSAVSAGGRLMSIRQHEEPLSDIFTRLTSGGAN